MKITGRRTRIVRTEEIEIEDGETRAIPYSGAGKQYRADSAIIEWTSHDGGETWANTRAESRGQVLKKDGADSKSRTNERFYRHQKWPYWLLELVADTDPVEDAR